MKQCSDCGEVKSLTEFYTRRGGTSPRSCCKVCSSLRYAAYRYGITVEEIKALRAEGKCRLCGDISERLEIDHDHQTGTVRGLLCYRCNSLIGWLESGYELPGMEVIANYLTKGKHEISLAI